jgi:hypothetical protein
MNYRGGEEVRELPHSSKRSLSGPPAIFVGWDLVKGFRNNNRGLLVFHPRQ